MDKPNAAPAPCLCGRQTCGECRGKAAPAPDADTAILTALNSLHQNGPLFHRVDPIHRAIWNAAIEQQARALAARDAAIAAERREASLLYGKVRHEFYVLGYGEAVADRRMREQFPLTTEIWLAANAAARAQIGEKK